MADPVKGYLTNDGRFFSTYPAAHFAEAKSKLLLILEEAYTPEAAADMLEFYLHHCEEIMEFLNAYKASTEESFRQKPKRVNSNRVPNTPES